MLDAIAHLSKLACLGCDIAAELLNSLYASESEWQRYGPNGGGAKRVGASARNEGYYGPIADAGPQPI